MYNDSMMNLHKICQIPQNCLYWWLSAFPTARETFVNSFPSPDRFWFWFCTDKIESIEWQNLVPRLRVGDCSGIHFLRWRLCDLLWSSHQNFSVRGTASPVRLLQGALVIFGSQPDFAMSVFGEVSKDIVLPRYHFCRTFRIWVLRNVSLDANTPSSSRLSANSSNHSGRSRKRSPCTGTGSSFLLVFSGFCGISTGFPMPECLYCHFVLWLDLMKSHQTCPAVTKLKTYLHSSWRNLLTILGQRSVHGFPCCTGFFCHCWSNVVSDHRSTNVHIRVLRRVCPATGLLACPQGFVPTRRAQGRGPTLLLPHLFALLHWQWKPLWSFWILEPFPVQLSSDLSCLACALMLWNPPQILFPRVSSEMVLVITKLLKVSGMRLRSFLWACGHFSPCPMHLCGRIFLVARFIPEICPWISEHAHVNNSLRWNLSIPNFLRGVRYLLRRARCASVPRILLLFRKIDLDYGGSFSWNTQPGWEATDPFPPLCFGFLQGWLSTSVCLNTHFSSILHPDSEM